MDYKAYLRGLTKLPVDAPLNAGAFEDRGRV